MAAAFEKRAAEIEAVAPEEAAFINVDVHGAVMTVMGALGDIRALRAEMATLRQLDQGVIDSLEEVALAAAEAQARYVVASTPPADVVALHEEGTALREMLRTDALALAGRKLIDGARLAGLKGGRGYKNVASELVEFATLLEERWSSIEGKTALTRAELHHAKDVGTVLMYAVGAREHAPAAVTEAAVTRGKAFTLLLRAYDQVRRAVTFLRWNEGDADSIVPSVYAGRGKRGKAAAAEGDTGGDSGSEGDADADSDAAPNGTHVSGGNGAGAVPVGMPGSSPFADS